MPRFLSCFPSRSASGSLESGLLDDTTNDRRVKQDCIFCNVSPARGFNVVYEDDTLIAFHDRTPRAKVHLLIIPRYHVVSSVRELTRRQAPILQQMSDLASTLIPGDPHPKMGFHIPPFSSVPHLHLHVFSGPHTLMGKVKYPITNHRGRKGLGWFVTLEQVRATVEDDRAVGVGRG
ncbi:hypothetical protein IAU60_002643 [Kwoniella sp. DSM 27419]